MNHKEIPSHDVSNPFLDKDQPIDIHDSRDLPHWDQRMKFQFVTFRLADSLPKSKVEELKLIKDKFEQVNPKPWTEQIRLQYYKLIGPIENRLLDNGFGSCILKIKNVRSVLSSSIMYFDNVKYEVIAFVIMPNHVHILLRLLESHTISECMHSIKSYSAKMINRLLNDTGSIWMKEYFDRMIRGEDHLRHCINYIIENPKYLNEGEFELYVKKDYVTAGSGPSTFKKDYMTAGSGPSI